MKPRGFTLVELLVVVVIIALLLVVLGPSLRSARAMARRAACANNLHHIGTAFQNHAARQGKTVSQAFPSQDEWPDVPQYVVGGEIYMCPDGPQTVEPRERRRDWRQDYEEDPWPDEQMYAVHTTENDLLIPFGAHGSCMVIDHGDYIEYRFEAGGPSARNIDFDDVVFYVSKTTPRIAEFVPDDPNRPYRGYDRATMSLRRRGEVVPGWEDFRHVSSGKTFEMVVLGRTAPGPGPGDGPDYVVSGVTNYGLNALAEQASVGSSLIAVLDYDRMIANDGEDMPEALAESARHLGQLNVLFCDLSVRPKYPQELDPVLDPDAWWP